VTGSAARTSGVGLWLLDYPPERFLLSDRRGSPGKVGLNFIWLPPVVLVLKLLARALAPWS